MQWNHFAPEPAADPARPGEHTEEILREFGFSETDIERLQAGKVFGKPQTQDTAVA